MKKNCRMLLLLIVDQKNADEIFRDINIEVNDLYFMNYLNHTESLRIWGSSNQTIIEKERKKISNYVFYFK